MSYAFTIKEALSQALAASTSGRYAQAERLTRTVLAQHPDHSAALSLLGLASFEQRKYEQARGCFERLARSAPQESSHWKNLGATLRALGSYEDALRCYTRAANCGATGARFLLDAALLEIDRHQPASAMQLLRRARRLEARDALINVHLAECCLRALRYEEARETLAQWSSFENLNDELIIRIAALQQSLGESAKAEEALRKFQTLNACAAALLTAAHVYERSNRLDDAENALQCAEQIADPSVAAELAGAQAQLAARRGDDVGACRHWRVRLRSTTARHEELFSYGRSLDAIGLYEEAYAALSAAHQAQVQSLREWVPELGDSGGLSDITSQGCDPSDVAQWSDPSAPEERESPIFIIGFPRSGTTLVEQALDAHPLLRSMDEQPFLQAIIDGWSSEGVEYPQALGGLSQSQLQSARERYWRSVRSRVQLTQHERVIDKNPLNLLRLPAICRLFPRASIVLAVRHPLDVIWSCFSQSFASPEFAWLCRDLLTLAHGYRAAFDFYYAQAAILRLPVYELSYERLVKDFPSQMRQLCSALNIEWHPNVLEPSARAMHKAFISTPSYAQVVQPIHTQAIGRWARYQTQIAPLLPVVDTYLDRWGY